MGLDVPNEPGAFLRDQAILFSTDLDGMVLAHAGIGVVSGCAVTWDSLLKVSVAEGAVHITDDHNVAAGDLTADAADANRLRIDLVVVNNASVKSIQKGTWDSLDRPVMPAIPANSVALAALYVQPEATALTADHIIDKRLILGTLAVMAMHGYGYHEGRIVPGGDALPGAGVDGELFCKLDDNDLYIYQS